MTIYAKFIASRLRARALRREVMTKLLHYLNRLRKKRQQKRRMSRPRRKYKESSWWQMLQDPAVRDISTPEGKLFRRRFRVPFPLFEKLMLHAQELGFVKQPVDAKFRRGIPLELHILGVLRVLGGNSCRRRRRGGRSRRW